MVRETPYSITPGYTKETNDFFLEVCVYAYQNPQETFSWYHLYKKDKSLASEAPKHVERTIVRRFGPFATWIDALTAGLTDLATYQREHDRGLG
jgi:hypothetical protein